ncbi:MAG: hypothetical protein IT210_19070 [Armatimonadetes bacterium]|nr:hypothetical protein [Armatimonadota bacterium]
MWQRFTERARRVIFYAQEEAARLGYNNVNTEHVLLGLIREEDCVAGRILKRLGIDIQTIRLELERNILLGDGRGGGNMHLTILASQVIELAYAEACRMNNQYIGTEHLLLGLILQQTGVASETLRRLNIDPESVRKWASALQQGPPSPGMGDEQTETGATTLDGAPPRAEPLLPNGNTRPLPAALKRRDFLSAGAFSQEEIVSFIFGMTKAFEKVFDAEHPQAQNFLKGKSLLLAVSGSAPPDERLLEAELGLQLAAQDLGGKVVSLSPSLAAHLESAAGLLNAWCDSLCIYGASDEKLDALAKALDIPVLNAGGGLEAPFEALADLYTIWHRTQTLENIRIACIGPSGPLRNSFLRAAAAFDKLEVALAPPLDDPAESSFLTGLKATARRTGCSVVEAPSPEAAARDASVLYIAPGAAEGEAPILSRERAAALRSAMEPKGFYLFGGLYRAEAPLAEGEPAPIRKSQIENRLHLRKAVLALVI